MASKNPLPPFLLYLEVIIIKPQPVLVILRIVINYVLQITYYNKKHSFIHSVILHNDFSLSCLLLSSPPPHTHKKFPSSVTALRDRNSLAAFDLP